MMRFEQDRRTRAEQRLLAALLRDNDCIRHCEQVMPRDFSHDAHGMIYLAIRKLMLEGKTADCVSVSMLMQDYRKTRGAADFGYLCSLQRMNVLSYNSGYYAAVMLEADERVRYMPFFPGAGVKGVAE